MFNIKKTAAILILLLIIFLYCSAQIPAQNNKSPDAIKAIWIETTSNLYLLKDRESICKILDKIKDAGFNTIIPEAKNSFGYTLYQSKIALKINDYDCEYPIDYSSPNAPRWAKIKIEPKLDILQIIIEEAHKRELKVIAAVDIFSEGLTLKKNPNKIEPAYTHPDWQSILYINGKFIPASESNGWLVFVNPIHSEVIAYELSILEELMTNYDIDGIVLDRARYANINADFSPLSRQEFEKVYGQPVKNWPSDIFNKNCLFNCWVSWRAQNIKNFIILARQKQKEIKPNILFMDYVASWYGSYYNEGVNWAAEGYNPGYAWTDKDWPKAGIAGLCDGLMISVYYRDIVTIQSRINLAKRVTQGKTRIIPTLWLKIHSPYEIKSIISITKALTPDSSIIIFDLSNIEKDEMFWKEIKKALQ